MLFIKDKAAYGQEIANHLNLKTSTISYHMEALINVGLIIVEKQNNRIYYRLNDKNMKEFMERFKVVIFIVVDCICVINIITAHIFL